MKNLQRHKLDCNLLHILRLTDKFPIRETFSLAMIYLMSTAFQTGELLFVMTIKHLLKLLNGVDIILKVTEKK